MGFRVDVMPGKVSTFSVWLCAVLPLLSFSPAIVGAQSSIEPELEEIVIPIRVHILRSAESSNLSCMCTEAQITTWFDAANTIWSSAAIRFVLESFVYEEANNASEFDRIAELGRDADPEDRRSVVHSTYPLDQRLAPG